MFSLLRGALTISCICLFTALPASGQQALVTSFNFGVGQFVVDPIRPRIYATVPKSNGIAVINTETLTLERPIFFIGSNPFGLDVSPDGTRLYVGNSGSQVNAIGVVDLNSLTTLPSYSMSAGPRDLGVGNGHIVYGVVSTFGAKKVEVINGLTGQQLGSFGTETYAGGLAEMSPDRSTLYLQETGLSPSKLVAYDVSNGPLGTKRYSTNTGSNGKDLAVSHNGQYVAAPNGAPYSISLLRDCLKIRTPQPFSGVWPGVGSSCGSW